MSSDLTGRSSRFWWFTTEVALLCAIALVLAFTALVDPFHSYWNEPELSFPIIAYNVSMLGIFALGVAVVIIAGGIDLSGGSVIAFSGTTCAGIMLLLTPKDHDPEVSIGFVPIAVALGSSMAVGLLIGNLHTWLITSIRLPPFIATLATLVGLRSLAHAFCEWLSDSSRISVNDPFFVYLGDAKNIWLPITVFLVLAAITWFLMRWTVLGRHLYALGGNEQAARLSGIKTENVKWAAYSFSALTASIASVFYIAKISTADPITLARGHELNAIAAAVVGGCSLSGGVGTIPGVVLGVVFLRIVMDAVDKIIKTGANMWEGFIVGSVVVLAVTLTQIQKVVGSGQQLFAGIRGLCTIPTLAITIGLVVTMTAGTQTGLTIGALSFVALIVVKILEVRRGRA